MENEIQKIKFDIQERNKGIFITPAIAGVCAVIIFFVNSYLLIAGLSVIILFCLFLFISQLQISKIVKNIEFNIPESANDIDTILKLIRIEKIINVNITPYLILYTGIVLCWAGIENTPIDLMEFAFLQLVLFALIYADQLNKKGKKYAELLEKLKMIANC